MRGWRTAVRDPAGLDRVAAEQDRVGDVAARRPAVRERIRAGLTTDGPTWARVLACTGCSTSASSARRCAGRQ